VWQQGVLKLGLLDLVEPVEQEVQVAPNSVCFVAQHISGQNLTFAEYKIPAQMNKQDAYL